MLKSIKTFWEARKALARDDTPLRLAGGTFCWCQSQRHILKKYDSPISGLRQKLLQLVKQGGRLLSKPEKQAYLYRVEELDQLALEKKQGLRRKLEKTEFELTQTREEKDQLKARLEEDGVQIKQINENSSTNSGDEEKRSGRLSWWMRHVFSFLGIWLLCEILLTLVQWISLRDILSIEDVLTRSLEIGSLILFFKIIAYRRANDPQRIYTIYMAFNISMLLMTIFVPPILHTFYGVGHPEVSTTEWSKFDIQGSIESESQTVTLDIPLWVNFYWNYHWIPAVLGLVFAIWLLFGLMLSKLEDEKESRGIKSSFQMPDNEMDEIENTYQSLVRKEADLMEIQAELESKINELERTPDEMINILETLESLHTKQLEIEDETERLKSELDVLIDQILLELEEFKNEFTRLLQNDNVRQLSVNPEWPTRDDVLDYFNIKNLKEIHDE